MFVKAFKIVSLACLVGLSLLYPLIELLDYWDGPGPSVDSELQIILLLTVVGIVFLLGHLVDASLIALLLMVVAGFHTDKPIGRFVLTLHPIVMTSPPLPLRI